MHNDDEPMTLRQAHFIESLIRERAPEFTDVDDALEAAWTRAHEQMREALETQLESCLSRLADPPTWGDTTVADASWIIEGLKSMPRSRPAPPVLSAAST